MKVSGITIHRNHVTITRTPDTEPRILVCPFCSRQGDASAYEYERMGMFSGACGPWCPHFGTPESKQGITRIHLTCGHSASLETEAFQWIKEQ